MGLKEVLAKMKIVEGAPMGEASTAPLSGLETYEASLPREAPPPAPSLPAAPSVPDQEIVRVLRDAIDQTPTPVLKRLLLMVKELRQGEEDVSESALLRLSLRALRSNDPTVKPEALLTDVDTLMNKLGMLRASLERKFKNAHEKNLEAGSTQITTNTAQIKSCEESLRKIAEQKAALEQQILDLQKLMEDSQAEYNKSLAGLASAYEIVTGEITGQRAQLLETFPELKKTQSSTQSSPRTAEKENA